MLEDAQMQLVLTSNALQDSLAAPIERVALDTTWDEIAKLAADNPPPLAQADNAAYVIFTSVSTGRPKGVLNEHRGICNRLQWMQQEYCLDDADTVIQKTPFSFDVSVWEFFWPLLNGARLVIAEPGAHRDSDQLCRLIQQEQITTIHFVPSMLDTFFENPLAADCRSLKRIICSGEALSNELRDRCRNQLAADLHNLYGPTEAAIDVTYWDCSQDYPSSAVPIAPCCQYSNLHRRCSGSTHTDRRARRVTHRGNTSRARLRESIRADCREISCQPFY